MLRRLSLVGILASCAAAPPPSAPPPRPVHAFHPSAPPPPPFEERADDAYGALAANGPTAEVIAQLRALGAATKVEPAEKYRLTGALSDDGAALVVRYDSRQRYYRVDPKTGAILGRRKGTWNESSSPILAGTHLAVLIEEQAAAPSVNRSRRAGGRVSKSHHLVAYDAVTGETVLDTPAVSIVSADAAGSVVTWWSPSESGNNAHVWNGQTRTEIDSFAVSAGYGFVLMPTSAVVVTGGHGDGLAVRDVLGHRTLTTLDGIPVRHAPLTPDGKLLALASRTKDTTGGKTILLDPASGKVVAASTACGSPGSLAFDRTGKILAVGDADRVCLLKVPSLELIRSTAVMRAPDEPRRQMIRDLHFFADDRALIGATDDAIGLAYDVATGELRFKRRPCWPYLEPERTTFVCRSPDGQEPNANVGVTMDRALDYVEADWKQSDLDALGARLWESRNREPLRAVLTRTAEESCTIASGVLLPKAACP